MPHPPRLLLATTSQGKRREWADLLDGLSCRLLTLEEAGIGFEVDESGRTFRANAILKAEQYGRASGLLTLAEDSGLAVRALGGGPGVASARWEGNDYGHKNALLIRLLDGLDGEARACRYVCHVTLRHPDGRLWHARGEVRGQIARQPAGSGGFGYDPVFWLPRLGRTMAELSDAEKHRLSHRGRAAGRLLPRLRAVLAAGGLP